MSTAKNSNSLPSALRTSRKWGFKFRITADGIMLLVVIILIGFAAWHSGTNLLYLIFSMLIAMYLLHGFLLSLNLSWLTHTETLPETATALQPFDITVSLSNQKRFFSSNAIQFSHRLANDRKNLGKAFFSHIPPGSQCDSSYPVAFSKRGIYSLEMAAVTTRYPFGFEERTQFRPVEKQILILPPTYNVASVAATIPLGFGDQQSKTRGSGTELYGLREYVPGENARHVHWKTSVRAQKIMVAEYFREERRQVMLVLNNGVAADQRDKAAEEFENAIILTASLARHLSGMGYEVGVKTSEKTIPYGQGSSHTVIILKHLALLQLTEPRVLKVPSNTALEVRFQGPDAQPAVHGAFIESSQWRPPADNTNSRTQV